MKYEKAVAEARQLVKRSEADQWRLAELTWQQVASGKSREQWARDTGMNRVRVQRLYRIWEGWGTGSPASRPSFTEAYDIVQGRTAEVEQHGTRAVAEARRSVRNMPPEQRAAVVREALADPVVAQQVMADPETRQAVQRVERERVEERFERGQIEPSDTTERLDRAQADYAWLVALDRAAGALAEAQSLMARAPKTTDHREAGKKTLRRIADLTGGLIDVLGADIDAEWEAMNR